MRPGSDIREKLFGRTYIRVVICAFIRSAEDEGARQESQGERELAVGTFQIWVHAETAPAHLRTNLTPARFPATRPVEATGVASVGAIEPASSLKIIRWSPTSDEEEGGGPVGIC